MKNLVPSLRKAFTAFTKNPFLFIWPTLIYVFMLFVFLFAAIGLLLLYFITLSVFNQPLDFSAIPTIAVFVVIGLLFVFFSCGLNAALARAYHSAFWKERTSLTRFFTYAVDKAPEMFGLMVLRDLIWLIFAAPAIAILVLFLKGVAYVDILVYAYVLFITFVIHMLFTPAFLASSAFGASFVVSLKHAISFLRRKHVYFIALFIGFAIAWVLDFVPIIDLAVLFIIYPVVYTAMIIMMEDSIKIAREED